MEHKLVSKLVVRKVASMVYTRAGPMAGHSAATRVALMASKKVVARAVEMVGSLAASMADH
jgi:hypothetical protein